MNKSARYALIAAACLKMGCGQKVNAVLAPSRHDLCEETSLAMSGQDDGDLPIDEDLPIISSHLNFDKALNSKEKDGETILTARERKQVARERIAYLIRRDLSAPRNPFALAIV